MDKDNTSRASSSNLKYKLNLSKRHATILLPHVLEKYEGARVIPVQSINVYDGMFETREEFYAIAQAHKDIKFLSLNFDRKNQEYFYRLATFIKPLAGFRGRKNVQMFQEDKNLENIIASALKLEGINRKLVKRYIY